MDLNALADSIPGDADPWVWVNTSTLGLIDPWDPTQINATDAEEWKLSAWIRANADAEEWKLSAWIRANADAEVSR